MSLPAEMQLPLILASLVADVVLLGLWLYGRMGRPIRRPRPLGLLLGLPAALGMTAGAGALCLLNALVIWSSAPSIVALLVSGVFGWVLALAIVAEAMPSQHDRLLMGLAFAGLALTVVALGLASNET